MIIPTTINCGFNQNGKIKYFGHLSFNKRREIFFRILWNEYKPSYFYDGVTSNEFDIRNVDHISFHADGTIHIKYYDVLKKPVKIIEKKLQNTIKNMPPDGYGILMILSIYDFKNIRKFIGQNNPLIFAEQKNISFHWELGGTNDFSLVFFLLGGSVDHRQILSFHFPDIFNISSSPFLMNYFGDETKVKIKNGRIKEVNDLGLLIGYTNKVIKRPLSQELIGPNKSEKLIRVENMLGINLASSDTKIQSLI